MGDLHRALLKELEDAPFVALEQLLEKKLKAAGAPEWKKAAKEIASALRENRDPDVRWDTDDDEEREIEVSLSEEDIASVEATYKDFVENSFPQMFVEVRDAAARLIGKTLEDDWPQQDAWERAAHEGFRDRLAERWGEAFKYLRMMLTISREVGGELHKKRKRSRSKDKQYLWEALTRLHVRGCQVVAEILTLMENGYADGAMARWRTLHEISLVATLVSDHGEKLAERYLDFEAVEAWRALDLYQKHYVDLGFASHTKREIREITKRKDAMVKRHGPAFIRHYGWAEILGIPGNTFSELEEIAGRVAMRPYYKLASYNVHAGTKGAMFRLGLMGQDGYLAGASNAGFVDPAQNTAFSLMQLNAALMRGEVGLDEQVQLVILVGLRDRIPPALKAANQRLKEDDLAFRQERRRLAEKRKARRQRKLSDPDATKEG